MNKSDLKKPLYPTASEFRRKEFLNIATAVGIGVTAASFPLSGICEEKVAAESKKTENADQKIKDQIILLAANLGHEDFKEREKATHLLVSLGKKFQKDKNSAMTDFIKKELEKGKKSKDPEVKKRAKNILLAINPKPVKSFDHPIMSEKIRTLGRMPR